MLPLIYSCSYIPCIGLSLFRITWSAAKDLNNFFIRLQSPSNTMEAIGMEFFGKANHCMGMSEYFFIGSQSIRYHSASTHFLFHSKATPLLKITTSVRWFYLRRTGDVLPIIQKTPTSLGVTVQAYLAHAQPLNPNHSKYSHHTWQIPWINSIRLPIPIIFKHYRKTSITSVLLCALFTHYFRNSIIICYRLAIVSLTKGYQIMKTICNQQEQV